MWVRAFENPRVVQGSSVNLDGNEGERCGILKFTFKNFVCFGAYFCTIQYNTIQYNNRLYITLQSLQNTLWYAKYKNVLWRNIGLVSEMTIVTARAVALYSSGKCYGKQHLKKWVLRRLRKTGSEGADVTCCGRLFQTREPVTGNARWPISLVRFREIVHVRGILG